VDIFKTFFRLFFIIFSVSDELVHKTPSPFIDCYISTCQMQGLLRQAESVTGKPGQNVRHRLREEIKRGYQKIHNQVADLHDKVVE
jgi:hypothetical protein